EKRDGWVVKLSGGQRQRLSLACALVNDPELLFLDEPTTGLDPQSRRQLWDLIESFRERGGTTLITTHYMDEAERLCDRVAIMDHGRVIALGTPDELIASLGAEHVVEFSIEGALDFGGVERLPSVRQARREAAGFALIVGEPHVAIPALLAELARQRVALHRLTTHHATLEDVFVSMTGRTLRDECTSGPRAFPALAAHAGTGDRLPAWTGGRVLGLRVPGADGARAGDRVPDVGPSPVAGRRAGRPGGGRRGQGARDLARSRVRPRGTRRGGERIAPRSDRRAGAFGQLPPPGPRIRPQPRPDPTRAAPHRRGPG